jgi:hypothetical protein
MLLLLRAVRLHHHLSSFVMMCDNEMLIHFAMHERQLNNLRS